METVGATIVYVYLGVLYLMSGVGGCSLWTPGTIWVGSDERRMGAPMTYRLNEESKKKGAKMLISIVFMPWMMIDGTKED